MVMSVDDTLKHARNIKKTINRLESGYCGVKAKDKLTDIQIQGYVFERMIILKMRKKLFGIEYKIYLQNYIGL